MLLSLPGTQYYIQFWSDGDAYNNFFGECYIDLLIINTTKCQNNENWHNFALKSRSLELVIWC